MPLRDHFADLDDDRNWGPVHGGWPMVIAQHLNRILPQHFVARPNIHIGRDMEIDVGAYEREDFKSADGQNIDSGLTTSQLIEPAVLVQDELFEPSEFETLIYRRDRGFTLVAALELVSPSNKDRPSNRQDFVNKCERHLKNEISLAIVDIVTSRQTNLYGELQEAIGAKPTIVGEADLYAVSCRGVRMGSRWRAEAWEHKLQIGAPLPTIPLWLTESLYVLLDLEATYEETCRSLRIG